ncbi:MAG TPA: carboxypeptidase regulatory-like domain-containing protein, partial [Terriglobales bacterium]|nr:carboxypeptidase regulatory-like domain-containing protein [Terriglobales bacterium]
SNEAPKGMRYVPRYYPDVTSADGAVALHIRAGDEGQADFHLVPAKSVSIKGLIVGADDRHHYNVMIGPRNFDFLRQGMEGTQVGPGGTFTIKDVLPGAYTISAMAFPMSSGSVQFNSDQSQRLVGQQEVEVGESDVEGIRITLIEAGKQLADVDGEIRLESANPKPLDQLRVMAQPTAAASFATPYDMGGASGGFIAAVKRDGSFQLKLRGGSHFYTNITANNRDFEDYYTKDVLYAGQDVTASGFTVGPTPGKLTVVVADDGARIEGAVLDANNHPYASATVIAVPEDQYRDWYEIYGRAESDQNGRFTMRGLRPGDYRLFAWEEMQDGAFMDPEFMRDYNQLGVSVHAKSNGRYEFKLKLIPNSE